MDGRAPRRYIASMEDADLDISFPPAEVDLLAGLNEPQRQAVLHRDGPLLVLAGPGSGKTRVIAHRAANLVRSGVPPYQVLAITFTNKAADEMKRRIAALGAADGMWVYTFHALGVRLLREFGPLARVAPGFTIYDEDDRMRLIKAAMERCNVGDHQVKPDRVQWLVSDWKNRLLPPHQVSSDPDTVGESKLAAVCYAEYERLLERHNAVDFDDLLMRVALVLREQEDVRERLGRRFRYIQIDEYQDTNHAQYLIAHYLAQQHRNICATGDPDQSIYGWRGADIGNILEFERNYPDATVVRLEQNYRSTGAILSAASHLIRANHRRKHKELWTDGPGGSLVDVLTFDNGESEARHVAADIAAQRLEGRSCGDFAIFYRINAVSRGLEEALRDQGVPYRIVRGLEFYNRREIKDLVAYLRLIVNPHDDVALLRIINTPARGIGKTTVDRLRALAAEGSRSLLDALRDAAIVSALRGGAKALAAFSKLMDDLHALTGTPAEIVDAVLRRSGLERSLKEEVEEGGEDRLANARELVTAAVRYQQQAVEASLDEFLARIALASDQDRLDDSGGAVQLMTLHAAKGLEFPVVYLVAVEQGMLPHERALRGDGDLEEERRLCFVGITRAMERLTLSSARSRTVRGTTLGTTASQFLRELPDEGVRRKSFAAAGTSWGIPGKPWLVEGGGERSRRGGRRDPLRDGHDHEEPVFSLDDPTRPLPPEPGPYAKWTPGMLLRHAKLGVGRLVWIRPAPGQTRAGIRFGGDSERTFILEFTPVEPADAESEIG